MHPSRDSRDVSIYSRSKDSESRASDAEHEGASSSICRQLKDTYKLKELVESPPWQYSIGLVIFANAILMGLEADYGDDLYSFVIAEHVFCWIFIAEMVVTVRALGWGYCSASSLFDGALVLFGVFNLYIIPHVEGIQGNSSFGLLRIVRLTRLLRVMRLLKMFSRLRVVLTAFVESFTSVMWVGSLILILNYTLGVALTQLVGQQAAIFGEDEDRVEEWFGTVGKSIRTLFIVLTLNEWDEVAIVLGRKFPNGVVFPAAMLYILITAFTMVSLITGLITEKLIVVEKGEMELRLEDMKKEEQEQMSQIMFLLNKADEGGDGNLSAEEVLGALEKDKDLKDRLEALEIPVDKKTLAPIIDEVARQDTDCEYGASIEKLARQLIAVRATARSSEMFLLKQEVAKLAKRMNSMGEKVERLAAQGAASAAEQEAVQEAREAREGLLKRQFSLEASSRGSRPLIHRGSHTSLLSTDRLRYQLQAADSRSRSAQGAQLGLGR